MSVPAIGPLFNVYSQKIPRTRKLIIYRSDTPCGARARDIDHLERPVAACAIGRASLVHTPSDWPAQMAARPTDDQQPARRDDSTNPPVHTQRARAHLNDTLCLPRPGVRPDERDRRDNSSRTRAPAIGARNWQCYPSAAAEDICARNEQRWSAGARSPIGQHLGRAMMGARARNVRCAHGRTVDHSRRYPRPRRGAHDGPNGLPPEDCGCMCVNPPIAQARSEKSAA